jgi:RNA polymerase primary sigma factor
MSYQQHDLESITEDSASIDSRQTKEPDEDRNAVKQYLNSISRHPLLSPEAELSLAKQLEESHRQLMYDFCTIRCKERPSTLPGIELVRKYLQEEYRDDKALMSRFNRAYTKIKSAQKGKYRLTKEDATRIKRLSDRIYDMLPKDAPETVRGLAQRLLYDDRYALPKYDRMKAAVAKDFGHILRLRSYFARSNLRLVVSIARRFKNKKQLLSDSIQEGNIGLLKAIDRYDYRRRIRFSTYATWWIRHAVARGIADHGRTIRVPVHMLDYYHKCSRNARIASQKLGRDPTPEEVVKQMDGTVTEKRLKKYHEAMSLRDTLSLDRKVSHEDTSTLSDFMQDYETTDPIESIEQEEQIDLAIRAMQDLKPMEKEVITRRLLTYDPETLKEIAKDHNRSRERIRQLEASGLAKLRRALMLTPQ